MDKKSRILVLGGNGLVGSSIVRRLIKDNYENIFIPYHRGLDLTNQSETFNYFYKHRPEYVFHCAAKVGGIQANISYPADFLSINLAITINTISAAYAYKVKKLINLGSSCIYPTNCPQPMREEYLLTGTLDPTNEPYAIAKISAIKLCSSLNKQYGTNFISLMPSNLYGINDNFNLVTSHVLPALIRKFHEAKVKKQDSVTVWGTGNPIREFTYVDDLAFLAVEFMKLVNHKDVEEFVNVGSGDYTTIKTLALMIKDIVEFEGEIVWDTTKPDGMYCKIMDYTKLEKMFHFSFTPMLEGIKKVYEWYKENEHA